MRISFCGSDLRAAVCALALALVTVMGACSSEPGPARTLDSDCKEEGTCECVRGSDCPGAQVCVNGECKTLVVDTPDEGEDPGEAPPDEGPDPGGTPVDVELEIEEGGFLWPCEEDSQCNSEKCWPLPGQDVCTVTCLESCPAPGWDCRGITEGSGVIFYCIPEIDRLCEACVGDDTCPGASNLCVETGGVDSCLTACVGDDNACPEGYACQDVTSVDGVEARQCVPESGFCQCTSDNAGTVLNCTVDNEFGSCLGEQLCQEGGVLTACDAKTPAKETCNGEDDDCNGFVDDDVEPGTCEETNDFGTCEGQLLCLPEVGEVCNAAIPAVETCDNLDNDCDGVTDNDVGGFGDGCDDNGDFCATGTTTCEGGVESCVGDVACAPGTICYDGTQPNSCLCPTDGLPCNTNAGDSCGPSGCTCNGGLPCNLALGEVCVSGFGCTVP